MLLTDYDYEYVLLDDDEERMKFYADNDCNTMPQVFYEGELIGGYVELEDFIDQYIILTS